MKLALATVTTLLATALAAPSPANTDLTLASALPRPSPDLFFPCKHTTSCVFPSRCDKLCADQGLRLARLQTCGYAPIRFAAKCCCR
ncbi:uncharacterized protein LOC62_03G003626 [Vanrija pseudolonga]|uniref:Uncharacterized protein n=1 Tax=Vanrija pseudolonga TaxID=143232 RepID=A0AAF1BJP8_9TREE|nr:hypothetical protein LOC62_03G003626 [Vanrija pseudolonga]